VPNHKGIERQQFAEMSFRICNSLLLIKFEMFFYCFQGELGGSIGRVVYTMEQPSMEVHESLKSGCFVR